MSGYLEGVLVLLAVNVVFAYGGFLPLAAGQLNLGLAGFAAIGAYASAYLSNVFKLSPLVAIPFAGIVAGTVALAIGDRHDDRGHRSDHIGRVVDIRSARKPCGVERRYSPRSR